MKDKRSFKVDITEGDAIIHLRHDKTVSLIFAEDGDTISREMAWPDHEVYKGAVQFALMIDSYFKNADGLDNLILHSPTGNIAAELMGKDLLSIDLIAAKESGIDFPDIEDEDTAEQEGKEIYSGKTPDNVLDLTEKLKNKEDNEKE